MAVTGVVRRAFFGVLSIPCGMRFFLRGDVSILFGATNAHRSIGAATVLMSLLHFTSFCGLTILHLVSY